jgi:hypothetical protein
MKALERSLAAGVLAALAAVPMAAQTIRVGTLNKLGLVVAYYRSPTWAATLSAKKAELAQAKAANDTKKAQELEAWGGAQQDLADRQLAGEAPITNILEALAPAFAQVAGKAHVSIIVADLPFAEKNVETVDVTGMVMDWLGSDEKTRSMVNELIKDNGAPPR